MRKKKLQKFEHYYNLMMSEKIAYEISPVTLSRIKVIWNKSISPFWRDVDPSTIDQQLVIEFMNWHKEHRPKVQFVNVFKYLGNVFNVMIESGAMELSKKPKLDLPKDEQKHHAKQKGRYITDEEFGKIISGASGWFKVYFLILFTSGFRKMELGKLELSRLNKVENRYIALLRENDTKTGRPRIVPFSDAVTALVEQQINPGAKYLFHGKDLSKHVTPQTIDNEWKKAKSLAGIDGRMRLHDCRHSCASNLAKDGINPIVVVTNLGMSLAMFQKTYLKLQAEDLFIASDSSNKRIKGL